MKRTAFLTHALCIALLAGAPAQATQADHAGGIARLAAKSRLILVGEMHGSAEGAAVVADLVKQWLPPRGAGGKRPALIVALEYPQSQAAQLEAYFRSDGGAAARKRLLESPFWSRDFQDGRSSLAVLALIDAVRVLARDGASIGLAAFDVNAEQEKTPLARDQFMADNLRAIMRANPAARVVALTGN